MATSNKGPGDPEGRKISRRLSLQAEEACRIAELLVHHLNRLGMSSSNAAAIAKDLRVAATVHLQRSHGRVEPRLTTKKTNHALLEGRRVNHLYLDESGTASLNGLDRAFGLGGIAMNDEDVQVYVARADAIKLEFFGTNDITFHEPHMRRYENIFNLSNDATKRQDFQQAMVSLLEETPFVVFGVGIRKELFKQQFLDTQMDPYLPLKVYDLAIMLMIERYVDYLSTNRERRIGRVHLESIGPKDDAEHQAAFANLLLYGTQFVSEGVFQSWLEVGCHFSPKTGSSPAEIADIVAREIFEWTASNCSLKPLYWDVLSKKIHLRMDGHFGKFGVKIFPCEDIEEIVMAHRISCGATDRN